MYLYLYTYTHVWVSHLIRWAKSFVRSQCGVWIYLHITVCALYAHMHVDAYDVTKTSAVMHVTWFCMNLRNAQNWDSKSERTAIHIHSLDRLCIELGGANSYFHWFLLIFRHFFGNTISNANCFVTKQLESDKIVWKMGVNLVVNSIELNISFKKYFAL